MAIEEPHYDLLRETPDFDLRRYTAHRIAEVEIRGDFDEVGGEAFRMLAGYIFGDNRGETRIAMTAPVTQQPAAPTGDTYHIRFMMPSSFTLEALPAPNNPRVQLYEQAPRLMAVRRYTGGWAESRYREQVTRLLDALHAAGLTPVGEPIYARYNSPFSLPILRRNEVMVEVLEPDIP
ncbi:MAG: heme-binding protein [Sphingobacteriia bacterium]|nr:heme-binding protein [Sphingobacteriia bacterium]NCC41103.1 heme-binding protein [Gammaproteobacteria bacterium]